MGLDESKFINFDDENGKYKSLSNASSTDIICSPEGRSYDYHDLPGRVKSGDIDDSMPGDPQQKVILMQTRRPVRLDKLEQYLLALRSNSFKFLLREYAELCDVSAQCPQIVGTSEINGPKNRYGNIVPFDYSRVRLKRVQGKETSDYINANFVPGYKNVRAYIAAQAPLPATVNDQWRMIWQQRVGIIIMITDLIEGGRKKCELYWPKPGFPTLYLDVEVTNLKEEVRIDYIIRIFRLKVGHEKRFLKHFQYLRWPDMGCPEDACQLIKFMKEVRSHVSPKTRQPIVVHCSAGVGRTGTYIAIDRLLEQIKAKKKVIDVFNTVYDIRKSRSMMVQTVRQYMFVYDVILDSWQMDADPEGFRLRKETEKNKNLSTRYKALTSKDDLVTDPRGSIALYEIFLKAACCCCPFMFDDLIY